MNEFSRAGDAFQVEIPVDDEGFLGRECPNSECLGYFKIEPGTGLEGENLRCRCPYCGFVGDHQDFWTQDQIEYVTSVLGKAVADELSQALKKLERKPQRGELFSIGIEVETKPYPIQYYAEKELERDLICDNCTLHYSIYGVFGFCPDCGVHNSWQIFQASRDVVERMLEMAGPAEPEIARQLVENAVEDAVSIFDGYGRELCRVNAEDATTPDRVRHMSFQNINRATKILEQEFDIDLSAPLEEEEWRRLKIGFEKRHVLAHRMGVIDERYVERTGASEELIGREVPLNAEEVEAMLGSVGRLAEHLHVSFRGAD